MNWGWETSAPVTSMDRYTSKIQKTEEIKLDAQSSKTKLAKFSEVATLRETEDPETQDTSNST